MSNILPTIGATLVAPSAGITATIGGALTTAGAMAISATPMGTSALPSTTCEGKFITVNGEVVENSFRIPDGYKTTLVAGAATATTIITGNTYGSEQALRDIQTTAGIVATSDKDTKADALAIIESLLQEMSGEENVSQQPQYKGPYTKKM